MKTPGQTFHEAYNIERWRIEYEERGGSMSHGAAPWDTLTVDDKRAMEHAAQEVIDQHG